MKAYPRGETMRRILFFTHCSGTKDDSLRGTGAKVPPCRLYKAPFVQQFCKKAQSLGVPYAIFSDLYGFVFSTQKIEWYDVSPEEITQDLSKKERLFLNALATLREFEACYFYHLPDHVRPLHRLYRQLVEEMRKNGINLIEITSLSEIDEHAESYE